MNHKKMKSGRTFLSAACTIAIMALFIASCGKEEEKPARKVVRPVKMMTVESSVETFRRAFPGKVQASQKVDLAFKVSGPLIEFPVEEGQEAKKGDLLARIDPRDFKTKIEKIDATIGEARANLKSMQIGARPEDIKVLEAEVAAANSRYINAEKQYKRYRDLYVKKQVSKAEFDKYRSDRDVAKAQLDTAKQNLDKGKRGARKEDIEAMKSNIKGLEAQRKNAQDAMGDTYLRAPFSGVIASKFVDNFQEVRAKQPIVSLQDVSSVEIVVNVPESLMATLRKKGPGTMVAEFATAPGKQYALSLKEYSTEADPRTQTYRVTLLMPQPEELNVLPGMTANVLSTISPKKGNSDQIVIPAIAVFADEAGAPHVWVVDQKTMNVHRRKVTTGDLTGTDSIRIVDGLKPGEMIAVAGVSRLREGMQVRPLAK